MNFAIIGCGAIGSRHAKQANRVGKLVAVCDIKKPRAWLFSKAYGGAPHYRMEGKYRDIDVVSICTPNYLHAEQTIQALQAGCHVICEKPMALTVKDCERMMLASEEAGKHLFIVKQNRYNPPIQALKKAIDSGAMGKILSVQVNCFWNRNKEYFAQSDWKGDIKKDGGVLYTQFSHFIDLMLWMFGKVTAISKFTDFKKFHHMGICILSFENSYPLATLHYTIDAVNKNMEGSITVFGEKATVKVGGEYLDRLEYCEGITLKVGKSAPANQYKGYQGSMSNHDKVYDNVIEVLKGGQMTTTPEDGLRTIELIERIK